MNKKAEIIITPDFLELTNKKNILLASISHNINLKQNIILVQKDDKTGVEMKCLTALLNFLEDWNSSHGHGTMQ